MQALKENANSLSSVAKGQEEASRESEAHKLRANILESENRELHQRLDALKAERRVILDYLKQKATEREELESQLENIASGEAYDRSLDKGAQARAEVAKVSSDYLGSGVRAQQLLNISAAFGSTGTNAGGSSEDSLDFVAGQYASSFTGA